MAAAGLVINELCGVNPTSQLFFDSGGFLAFLYLSCFQALARQFFLLLQVCRCSLMVPLNLFKIFHQLLDFLPKATICHKRLLKNILKITSLVSLWLSDLTWIFVSRPLVAKDESSNFLASSRLLLSELRWCRSVSSFKFAQSVCVKKENREQVIILQHQWKSHTTEKLNLAERGHNGAHFIGVLPINSKIILRSFGQPDTFSRSRADL